VIDNPLVQYPFPGIQVHENEFGFKNLRLHYTADPQKGTGELTFVESIKRSLTPWALEQYLKMTDKSLYLQEYEIDASATLGQLLYTMDREATLVHSSQMPSEGTDYFAIDPHPMVPFASLWGRVDRWGDLWIYRELWPSKVAFRYENGRLMGQKGNVPEDDNKHTIEEYVEAIWWLESELNPQNKGVATHIRERVIDYAARAFGKGTQDDPEQPNFQQRLATHASQLRRKKGITDWSLEFKDAKKDLDVGIKEVNAWFKPRDVRHPYEDRWVKQSRIRICEDRCPELIYQLETNRNTPLTPLQAESNDPMLRPLKKRNHLTDDLRYMVMANPIYVPPYAAPPEPEPIAPGFSY
jgi:hypothetical protein